MIGFGLTQDGGYYHYRDHKLMLWTFYPPHAGTADWPETKTWQARCPNYEDGLLYGNTADDLVTKINVFTKTHPFLFTDVDAQGIMMTGLAGFVLGGVAASGAALLGFPRVAKLGGLKSLIGLGVAGTGMVIAGRVGDRNRAKMAAAAAKPALPGA